MGSLHTNITLFVCAFYCNGQWVQLEAKNQVCMDMGAELKLTILLVIDYL